jgi:hypothetical protein
MHLAEREQVTEQSLSPGRPLHSEAPRQREGLSPVIILARLTLRIVVGNSGRILE